VLRESCQPTTFQHKNMRDFLLRVFVAHLGHGSQEGLSATHSLRSCRPQQFYSLPQSNILKAYSARRKQGPIFWWRRETHSASGQCVSFSLIDARSVLLPALYFFSFLFKDLLVRPLSLLHAQGTEVRGNWCHPCFMEVKQDRIPTSFGGVRPFCTAQSALFRAAALSVVSDLVCLLCTEF